MQRILQAVRLGDLGEVKKFSREDFEKDWHVVAREAIRLGQEAILRYLLEKGFVNPVDTFIMAALHKNMETIMICGKFLGEEDFVRAMTLSMEYSCWEAVGFLITRGRNVKLEGCAKESMELNVGLYADRMGPDYHVGKLMEIFQLEMGP
jgi:hypothetical protein